MMKRIRKEIYLILMLDTEKLQFCQKLVFIFSKHCGDTHECHCAVIHVIHDDDDDVDVDDDGDQKVSGSQIG